MAFPPSLKQESNMKQTTAYGIMILVSFFWAGSFVAGKFSGPEVPAFSSSFLRLGIASMILYPFARKKAGGTFNVAKGDWKILIALGLIGMFGYQALFFISVNYNTVIATSTINSMNPIFVTSLLAIVLQKRMKWRIILALAISFFGVVMAITDGEMSLLLSALMNIGNVFMILAILCWSVYGVISQLSGINNRMEPIVVTWYAFTIAVIALFPLFLAERPWIYIPDMTWQGWGAILYMAIFPSFIGYSLQQESIKAIGAQKTAIYINFVPVFSMLLSIWLLNDHFTISKVIAIVAVIIGVVMNNYEKNNFNRFKMLDYMILRKRG